MSSVGSPLLAADVATGSLGQGLPIGVGIAYAGSGARRPANDTPRSAANLSPSVKPLSMPLGHDTSRPADNHVSPWIPRCSPVHSAPATGTRTGKTENQEVAVVHGGTA